jgi:hypothetical protein
VTDSNNAEFYSDPSNVVAGVRLNEPPVRPALTQHVPIRFSASVIAQVKVFARQDGMSVSSWIRHLVFQELERRSRPETKSGYEDTWVRYDSKPASESRATNGQLVGAVG